MRAEACSSILAMQFLRLLEDAQPSALGNSCWLEDVPSWLCSSFVSFEARNSTFFISVTAWAVLSNHRRPRFYLSLAVGLCCDTSDQGYCNAASRQSQCFQIVDTASTSVWQIAVGLSLSRGEISRLARACYTESCRQCLLCALVKVFEQNPTEPVVVSTLPRSPRTYSLSRQRNERYYSPCPLICGDWTHRSLES